MSKEERINLQPTIGQLERELSQKISALYYDWLDYRVDKVECHLFNNKIVIFLENVITPVEQVLASSTSEILRQLRTFLDNAIKPKVEQLIAETIGVEIDNCIYNTIIETGDAVVVVILDSMPQVRCKKSNYQNNKHELIPFQQHDNKVESYS